MKTKSNLPLFWNKYYEKEIFFFAGSGISYDSYLPSAYSILQATIESFLPKNIDLNDRKLLLDIQPEVFYEILLKISQNNLKVLDIWQVLYSKVNIKSYPNLNHYFIVKYAEYSNLPIFTTNFDSMFEEVAKELGIEFRVYLPKDEPPYDTKKHVAICKLHGSIEGCNGNFTPENIFTTMTTITKLNTKWILFLTELLKEKHITFVGYSGRDIDIFPYIEKSVSRSQKMFWINRFDWDEFSKKYAGKIEAIQLNFFPKTVFRCILKNQNIQEKEEPFLFRKKEPWNIKALIKSIQKNLDEKNILDENQKEILYLILLKSIGQYQKSYAFSKKFYEDKFQNLSIVMQLIFLEHFSQLNHEVSKYDTYRSLAKKMVKKSLMNKDINHYLMGKFFISESYRMNIPNDIYFPHKRDFREYIFVLFTLISFFSTYIWAKILIYFFKKGINDNVHFEMIEHKVRFIAIFQGILGNSQKGWNKYIIKILNKLWNRIKEESYSHGYTSGIANSGKFKQRLKQKLEIEEFEESNNIYNLLNSSTGKELNFRNKADKLLLQGEIDKAKEFYLLFIKQAKKSGNKLNEIKGLMAIAFMNYKSNNEEILQSQDRKRFLALSQEIEGVFWKKYFNKIWLKLIRRRV